VNVEYLDLADLIAIAQAVTGLNLHTVMNVTNIDLADSALHAPAAGFGDEDLHPDFVDEAADRQTRSQRPVAGREQASRMGSHSGSSSRSTTGCGTPSPPSTMQKQQCSPLPEANAAKQRPPNGSAPTSAPPRNDLPSSADL
jgi:hypothetical protein